MALAGDHLQILVGGYELTGDYNQVQIADSRAMLEQTSFGDGVHNFAPGSRQFGIKHGGFMNADTGRSHPVLKSANLDTEFSLFIGENAVPAVGNLVFSIDAKALKYSVAPQFGQVIMFGADLFTKGNAGGWGQALAVPVEFTNTTTGSGVDNGAATSNGGAAYLHVLTAAASDTYQIIVEHDDNSGFTSPETLVTFTLDASTIGSERIAVSGSIQQYTRFKATRSGSAGDTVEIAVTLVRL